MNALHRIALALLIACAPALAAQIPIVDIIPASMSDETERNSEPSISVDPTNPQRIVASVFVHAPAGMNLAPLFVSTDGGNNWLPAPIIPTCTMTCWNANDITIRFATAANPNQANLYAGILSFAPGPSYVALRTFDQALATAMTSMGGRNQIDQPYIQARGVVGWFDPGKERVYIGMNDSAMSPRTSTVDSSIDAAAGMPSFTTTHIDAGMVVGRDNYQTRPAVAADGHVYAAFYRRLSNVANVGYTADVVVVRDDNWAKGMNPFTSLTDAGSMPPVAGQRVAPNITVTDDCCCGFGCMTPAPIFPGQRQGGDLFIAVDPNDSSTVYVSWADRQMTDAMTLHLRRSTDAGQTWPNPELLTVPSAKNAAIAINSQGRIAYLYQQWTGTTPNHHWQTHLRRFVGGMWTDDILNDEPCEWSSPGVTDCIWTGDYDYMTAAGKNFYGIFSATNDPANFPAGTTFLRNHDNAMPPHLLQSNNMPLATQSTDPFFFRTTELAAGDDFYVRDWTDSVASFDHGLEPSSHPNFYDFSDVWNERTNDPLPFDAQNRPQSNDPQPMMMGSNFAFTRISRETGGGAADVSVDFFFSDGGVGVPYQPAGSTSVHLNAGQPQATIGAGSGVTWNLPSGASNHVCLAAQIHTGGDPFIPPTLDGHAPGWPTGTDLAVLGDNNKAQRNMQVFTGMSGGMSMWALVHNASKRVRDMTIGIDVDPVIEQLIGDAQVGQTYGREVKSQPLRPHTTVTFPDMKPGEDRWLTLRGTLRDVPARTAGAVRIYELNGQTILNGYGFQIRGGDPKEIAQRNIFQHAVVFARTAELFGSKAAEEESKRARSYLDRPERYDELLTAASAALKALAGDLIARNGGADPFGLKDAFTTFAAATGPARASAHLSLLNAIDANETAIQRAKR